MTSLTKAELRRTRQNLARLLPPGGRPLTATEIVEVNADIAKIDALIVESASALERGKLVLSWRLPKDLVPTQNDLRGIKPWRMKKIKAALHDALLALVASWPDALAHGSTRRRWVRTTRFTTTEPDELSCDGTGFKLAIDALKVVGMIADDDRKHLHREPGWEKCKPGGTSGLLELFLLADEQVATAGPAFAPVQQVIHTPGIMTKMLKGGM